MTFYLYELLYFGFVSLSWLEKSIVEELCRSIRPFKDQEAPEDQIFKSALLWELNSIDGGIFRCHLWAQFFWHGTNLSALLHRTRKWKSWPRESINTSVVYICSSMASAYHTLLLFVCLSILLPVIKWFIRSLFEIAYNITVSKINKFLTVKLMLTILYIANKVNRSELFSSVIFKLLRNFVWVLFKIWNSQKGHTYVTQHPFLSSYP